jgi:FkbM family methyltransferase
MEKCVMETTDTAGTDLTGRPGYPDPPTWLTVLRWIARRFYRAAGLGIGAGALAEAVRGAVARRGPPGPFVSHDFMDRLDFVCDLSEHMGSQIFFRGAYSGNELKVLSELLSPDAVFIDVGANQGEFSVFAGAQSPAGKVYSFEPQPEARHRLHANLRLNKLDNVVVEGCALGDTDGQVVTLYTAREKGPDGTTNTGLGTLYRATGRDVPLCEVTMKTLDTMLLDRVTRLDAIKIDVEGAEMAVLRGGERLIARYRPAIIFESNATMGGAAQSLPEAPATWLERRGYRLFQIGAGGSKRDLEGSVQFGNLLAVRNDRASGA